MSNTFSFLIHPVELFHNSISELIPGIEKVISVHYQNEKLKGILSQKNGNGYSTVPLNLEGMKPVLEEIIRDQSDYSWYNRENLPFRETYNGASKITLDLFSELQNVVLLIRLPSTSKTRKSIVFVYLNENPGNFGLTNSETPLTTVNKNIIAKLLRNMLVKQLKDRKNNLEVLENNNLYVNGIIAMARHEKERLQQNQDNYEMSLVAFCKHYIEKYEQKSGKQFSLSAGAIKKIKDYRMELWQLPDLILKSLAFAQSLNLNEDIIEVLELHLQLNTAKNMPETSISDEHPSQIYEKSFALLNKLEEAALVVKFEKLKMTGTNVGQAFNHPITAPAITDALYNHKSKINSLVKMYPGKWKTIRSEFRPLKNILKD